MHGRRVKPGAFPETAPQASKETEALRAMRGEPKGRRCRVVQAIVTSRRTRAQTIDR